MRVSRADVERLQGELERAEAELGRLKAENARLWRALIVLGVALGVLLVALHMPEAVAGLVHLVMTTKSPERAWGRRARGTTAVRRLAYRRRLSSRSHRAR